jgi:hypothetical protein
MAAIKAGAAARLVPRYMRQAIEVQFEIGIHLTLTQKTA